jgi:hypothetical protein
MCSETEAHSRRGWRIRPSIGILLGFLSVLAVPSCQDLRGPEGVPHFPPTDSRESIQEGEATLRDGEEMWIGYPKPFQSPPRLVIVELLQSHFEEKPYNKSDFQLVQHEARYFILQNTHAEQGRGAWATVKWRAQGILASGQPAGTNGGPAHAAQDSQAAQAQLIARIKQAGGQVVLNPPDGGLIVVVDLHRTGVTDADLEPLQGLTSLHTLNLYGTQVTDAGLKYVGGLTSLQTLYLNETAVTDAGLPSLQRLTNLRELGLNRTHVTDAGLPYLRGLSNLSSLTFSGVQITDRGLAELKGLPNLRQLFLSGTSVTPTGVQDLKRALPKIQIIQ